MLTPEQKHYTGRAMLALSAAHAELMRALRELLNHDPERAGEIALSASRNMSQAAALLTLIPPTVSEPDVMLDELGVPPFPQLEDAALRFARPIAHEGQAKASRERAL